MIRALGAGLLLAAAIASPSLAQESLFGRETLHGMAEFRVGGATGEQSWTDGGFGKSDIPAGDHGWRTTAGLSQAVVEWKPRFSFNASAVVSAQWQSAVDPKLDLDEAYLKFRTSPSPNGRLSARLGFFYPPISLEHGGVGWTTTDLLSASAINSWIGEEVKVGGLEATWEKHLGDHTVSATAAVFGWNDTSGTLVSFRGWALHGLRAGSQTEFPLPPLTRFMTTRQADETYPNLELDHRGGYYAQLEWRPPVPVVVQALHYDNGGDRTSVAKLQWAWETKFDSLALQWKPGAETEIRSQVLNGRTWMGYPFPETWVDVGFHSAYVMATRSLAEGSASVRADWFGTTDHSVRNLAGANEHGWALTAGWRRPLTPWADVLVEAQQIDSTRPARRLAAEAARQDETVLQTAVRLHF